MSIVLWEEFMHKHFASVKFDVSSPVGKNDFVRSRVVEHPRNSTVDMN